MEPLRLPTEEEICDAAREGEHAVVASVSNLVEVIVLLAARVLTPEDQLAKTSGSGGKPPSSDELNKPRNHSLGKSTGNSI